MGETHVSKHLQAIEKDLQGDAIRAAGEAMGMAVAVTDRELVTGKARLFGATVVRFPLGAVCNLRTIPNPSANLLEIEFAETAPVRSLMIMYQSEAQADFEAVIALIRQHISPQVRQ